MNQRQFIFGIVGFALASCCLPFFAAADFTSEKWAYARDIIISNPDEPSEYATVELDEHVYENAQTSFQDLRVIDDQNLQVASIVQQISSAPPAPLPVKIINRQTEKGRSIYTVDAGENKKYNGLQISTGSRNFSRRVTIEGSNSGVWELLREDGYVMDFSRDESAQSLKINFALTTYRYLRVTIFDKNDTPLTISGIELFSSEQVTNPLHEYASEITMQEEDAKLRATIVTVSLNSAKIPTSKIEFITDNNNFHRRVKIEHCDADNNYRGYMPKGAVPWRCSPLISGNIFDINIDRTQAQNLSLEYPEVRTSRFQITIYNYDDRPLKIRGVKVSGYPRQLLFKREVGRSYRLMYGNEYAKAPQYDLAQLSAYLTTTSLKKLKLGKESKLEILPEISTTQNSRKPFVLWTVILIAIGFLGTLIYRLAKMNANP